MSFNRDTPKLFYTIYKVTNKLNGKFYIGKHQTKDLNDGYMGSGKLIKAAIKKYGIDNFTKEILHVFQTEEEMNQAEKSLIVLGEESYNLKFGGEGGFDHLNDGSPSHIMRIKKAYLKSKKYMVDSEKNRRNGLQIKVLGKGIFGMSKEARIKSSEKSFLGKKHTQETKTKIGLANSKHQTGSKNSQYGTCWITNGTENKKIRKDDLDNWISLGYYKGRNTNSR